MNLAAQKILQIPLIIWFKLWNYVIILTAEKKDIVGNKNNNKTQHDKLEEMNLSLDEIQWKKCSALWINKI